VPIWLVLIQLIETSKWSVENKHCVTTSWETNEVHKPRKAFTEKLIDFTSQVGNSYSPWKIYLKKAGLCGIRSSHRNANSPGHSNLQIDGKKIFMVILFNKPNEGRFFLKQWLNQGKSYPTSTIWPVVVVILFPGMYTVQVKLVKGATTAVFLTIKMANSWQMFGALYGSQWRVPTNFIPYVFTLIMFPTHNPYYTTVYKHKTKSE